MKWPTAKSSIALWFPATLPLSIQNGATLCTKPNQLCMLALKLNAALLKHEFWLPDQNSHALDTLCIRQSKATFASGMSSRLALLASTELASYLIKPIHTLFHAKRPRSGLIASWLWYWSSAYQILPTQQHRHYYHPFCLFPKPDRPIFFPPTTRTSPATTSNRIQPRLHLNKLDIIHSILSIISRLIPLQYLTDPALVSDPRTHIISKSATA